MGRPAGRKFTAERRICAGRIYFARAFKSEGPHEAVLHGEHNTATIGCQGYYEWKAGRTAGLDLNAYATRDIALG